MNTMHEIARNKLGTSTNKVKKVDTKKCEVKICSGREITRDNK